MGERVSIKSLAKQSGYSATFSVDYLGTRTLFCFQMATEPLPQSIPKKPTTIRFPESIRIRGEAVAAKSGKSFAQLVRDAVVALIRHEEKNTPETL